MTTPTDSHKHWTDKGGHVTDMNSYMEFVTAAVIDVGKVDRIRHQAQKLLELDDHDLETISYSKGVNLALAAVYTDQCLGKGLK